MDPKKQELNPELKEIYDRVMNTQAKSEAQPQSAPSQPPPATPQAPAAPPGTVRNPAPPPPVGQNILRGATAEANQDPFFSPPPQRSITDTKPFVFTGNKVTTPQAPYATQSQMNLTSSKRVSGPIIAVLVVVLIVVWTLFWAKFFGLI